MRDGCDYRKLHPVAEMTPELAGAEEGRALTGLEIFSCDHADGVTSIDLFIVSTLSLRLLYGFLVLRHHRRRIMWLRVTASLTAEWIARQLTEACGWEAAPA